MEESRGDVWAAGPRVGGHHVQVAVYDDEPDAVRAGGPLAAALIYVGRLISLLRKLP